MLILSRTVPEWPTLAILEASPGGPASARLASLCPSYTPTHFFEGVPSGTYVAGVRREDLRDLTFEEASVDVVITQDVFEHVVNPAQAFREIARVLRPGGCHVWTVPIYSRNETVVRVDDNGSPLCERQYHDDPIGDGRSLVVREWGTDIVSYTDGVSSVRTERHDVMSRLHGVIGTMSDVLVSRKHATR